ncbi:lipid IV(A) 3-deoxy-D-manno-octulosonic acid transferase [Roseitalea porphyridii]|uniref:3-deoxy-D-manno-octulosonic acid transferase n=1 Tax=Roseitalea porphyridii TaxID=1852022 RepID=A0A4P6UXG0_9HYPH|nr:lipid IV(A) 3-deoxy-D-manno-octulosonic acid transferase [Roseitalea porphyridii]QBK29495.1 3-deoxy-D-manno-octulosonic acid transferase [Roseitalea porphyridii]
MSERWARLALQTYRWAGMAAYPFMGIYVGMRATRGKEQHDRRGERYGKPSATRPLGPLVWVHAVSVGETGAVSGLIGRLRAHDIPVVLTTGTVTSAALARDRFGDDVLHQYVPLDLKPAVSRFLNYWQPDLAVFAESEIWPMTILELGARRIPQVLINGRMSDRSFKRWQNRLALAESLFENLSHVAAQTEKDGERFRALGARPVTVSGNLKADVPVPSVDPGTYAQMQARLDGRPVWLAVSTHEGEEMVAARVHKMLKKRWPGLLTVIVPRHPTRAEELAAAMGGMGLSVARRTVDKMPAAASDIFLGDTIGEMGLYLRMGKIAFVGRSLTAEGGQNPLEPAMLGCAVLTGPNLANFEEIYGRFCEARAARVVDDEMMLAKAVNFLLGNAALCDAMAEAGRGVIADMSGALDRTWQTLSPYVQPLVVKARLAPGEAALDGGDDAARASQGGLIGW